MRSWLAGISVAAFATAARAQTPRAAEQIREVAHAVQPLARSTAAADAGYAPRLGWIPTMGTHWVNLTHLLGSEPVDLTAPSVLMYSPVNGRDSLVGAAYAYVAPVDDTTRPTVFDGNPPWHDHPNLAPAGQTLVMLHVWFVPSPDGPFAGHNPNLSFWAVGLAAPDSARLRDPVAGPLIRRAALALAVIPDTDGLFPFVARREPMHTLLAAERDSIAALIPLFGAADTAGDVPRWDAVAARAARHWATVRAAYLDEARNDVVRARMVQFMDELEAAAPAMGHHH